ncbi:MAG: DUF3662 and FHA domain-containing protein [Actinomycetota bacterium]
MSLLKDLEGKLERLVEGTFAKGFKSSLQPVELAKRLDREMEAGRTISVSKIYIPNEYIVRLSPNDFAAFSDFKDKLVDELKSYLDKRRKAKNYSVMGAISVILKEDKSLPLGRAEAEARLVTPSQMENPDALASVSLIIDGEEAETFWVGEGRATIGRLDSNEISVPDPGLSRRHAEINISKDHVTLTDLGSTNGTFVNGKRIAEIDLKDGAKITAGDITLVFRRL